MLDDKLRPYLIEVNSNPCLELACPLLNRLIPELIDNLFKITIDPIFPPPLKWPNVRKANIKENSFKKNRF
jgi:tubulin polyglutamylase TTLL1